MINQLEKAATFGLIFEFGPKFAPAILLCSPLISLRCFNSVSQPEKVINLSRLFDFFPFDIFLPIVFGRLTFRCTGIVFSKTHDLNFNYDLKKMSFLKFVMGDHLFSV